MTATPPETPADRAASRIKREDNADHAQTLAEAGLPERTPCRCGTPMERDKVRSSRHGLFVTWACTAYSCDRLRYDLIRGGEIADNEWGRDQ